MGERIVFGYEESHERPQHNRLVLYTGISGVGKDFLIGKLKEADPNFGNKYKIFPFGELLFQRMQTQKEALRANFINRDSMRDILTQEQIAEQIDLTSDDIIAQQPGIINTHLIYRQQQSLVINPNVIRRLNPQAIVFLHADPKDVQRWRAQSPRQRDVSNEAELIFFQNLAYDVTKRVGEYIQVPVHVIENKENNVAANVQQLRQVASQLIN